MFAQTFALHQLTVPKRRFGSNSAAPVTGCRDCFSPNSCRREAWAGRPKWARSDQSALRQNAPYSITSSASASSLSGIVKPSALAVFKLMTSSNFVDCTTGRSAGLAPLRICPA